MPVGFARALESSAQVTIDSGTVLSMRAKKTGVEIEKIRAVQKKNERGVTLAIDAIRKQMFLKTEGFSSMMSL